MTVEDHFKKMTPLIYSYESDLEDEFAGSGFFYHSQYTAQLGLFEDQEFPPVGPYLVTNKHIVEPVEETPPDSLKLYLRDDDVIRPVRYEIELYDGNGDPTWMEHPNDDVDVILILLDYELGPDFTYTRHMTPQRGDEISGGHPAKVVGFPGLLPEFRHFPIMRSALLSSPFEVSFEYSNYFFIDARLHDGMSGSPVLSVPAQFLPIEEATIDAPDSLSGDFDPDEWDIDIDSYYLPNTKTYLLGVYSDEQIEINQDAALDDYRERLERLRGEGDDQLLARVETLIEQLEGETGLNVTWHAKLIEEIREMNDVSEDDAVPPSSPSFSG